MEPKQKLSSPASLWRKAYDELNKEPKGGKLLINLNKRLSKSIKYKGKSLNSTEGERALMEYIDKASKNVNISDNPILKLSGALKDVISAGASANFPASIAVAGLFMVSEIYRGYENQKTAMVACKTAVINYLTARLAAVNSIQPLLNETQEEIVDVRTLLAENYIKFFKVVLEITAALVIYFHGEAFWEKGKNLIRHYAWDVKLAELKEANEYVEVQHKSLRDRRQAEEQAPQKCLRPGWTMLHQHADDGSLNASHIREYRPYYHLDAKTDELQWTALMLTAKHGHESAAKTLLLNGANIGLVKKDGETCLHIAASRGRKSIVELLLRTRDVWTCEIDPAYSDRLTRDLVTPVIGGAQGDKQDNRTYTKQSFIDHRSKRGRTALSRAAENGHAEIVRKLLNAKADPSIGDADGLTPLMYAACHDRIEVLRKLREHSDSFWLESHDNKGLTALHHAAESDRYEAVKWLIKYKAPLDVRSKSGQKPKDIATGRSKQLLQSSDPQEQAKK